MTHSSTSLTPREREVLLLIAQGYQYGQAADILCIAPQTVKTHLYHVRLRLGAHNSVHAVYLAMVDHDSSGENATCGG